MTYSQIFHTLQKDVEQFLAPFRDENEERSCDRTHFNVDEVLQYVPLRLVGHKPKMQRMQAAQYKAFQHTHSHTDDEVIGLSRLYTTDHEIQSDDHSREGVNIVSQNIKKNKEKNNVRHQSKYSSRSRNTPKNTATLHDVGKKISSWLRF
jgi:hypothetical protein